VKRAALVIAGLFASACGLLVGIDSNLGTIAADDGGGVPDTTGPTDAADASILEDAPIPGDGSIPLARRPPEGWYWYDIDGGNNVTGVFASASPYGPDATVEIAYVPGTDCFDQIFHFSANDTETMRFCVSGPQLLGEGGSRDQVFPTAVPVSLTTTETCTPGDIYLSTTAQPGDQWEHQCAGQTSNTFTSPTSLSSSFTLAGTYTYVADETFPVMGNQTATKHFHDDRDASGLVRGTDNADWYFSRDDWSLQRFRRAMNIVILPGPVNYQESFDMTLSKRSSSLDAASD
jgi:hypothetical protein